MIGERSGIDRATMEIGAGVALNGPILFKSGDSQARLLVEKSEAITYQLGISYLGSHWSIEVNNQAPIELASRNVYIITVGDRLKITTDDRETTDRYVDLDESSIGNKTTFYAGPGVTVEVETVISFKNPKDKTRVNQLRFKKLETVERTYGCAISHLGVDLKKQTLWRLQIDGGTEIPYYRSTAFDLQPHKKIALKVRETDPIETANRWIDFRKEHALSKCPPDTDIQPTPDTYYAPDSTIESMVEAARLFKPEGGGTVRKILSNPYLVMAYASDDRIKSIYTAWHGDVVAARGIVNFTKCKVVDMAAARSGGEDSIWKVKIEDGVNTHIVKFPLGKEEPGVKHVKTWTTMIGDTDSVRSTYNLESWPL